MGLFKRNKQATERVQDLKQRVESLRKVDDEHRALTLDDFLAGDDAVTARTEPRYTQAAPAPQQPINDASLEAELQRYLSAHAGDEDDEPPVEAFDQVIAAPGFDQPSPKNNDPSAMRPISIDEFPPLPPLTDLAREPAPPASPPRLSADEEAALIAELQRYLKTDGVEGNEDALGEPEAPQNAEDSQVIAWPEPQPVDFSALDEEPGISFPDFDAEAPDDASIEDEPEPEASKVVEIDGRVYEEPKPRHWPSVPLHLEEVSVLEPAPDPEPRRRAVGDWEPL
jgi:hypothetical protein